MVRHVGSYRQGNEATSETPITHMKLPNPKNLIQSKNWTNYTVKELVDAGRLTAVDAAAQIIVAEQKKMLAEGVFPPLSEIREVARQWESLECEVLDLLLA